MTEGRDSAEVGNYPECAACDEPVQYDQIRGYYEHVDDDKLLHIECYEKFVGPCKHEQSSGGGER